MSQPPRRVLCVFAHPDDESFGPGGTIALWASQGAQIYLLCATRGESGNGPHPKETARIRSQELLQSAKILGIKNVEFLEFEDGKIGNNDLSKLEQIITEKIKSFRPDTVLTFNLNGVSGHLDHMAVASATTQSFKKTKIAKKIYYFTIPKAISRVVKNYFVYFPEGLDPNQMSEIIDVNSVWKTRLMAMNQHESQSGDIKKIKLMFRFWKKSECFIVRER